MFILIKALLLHHFFKTIQHVLTDEQVVIYTCVSEGKSMAIELDGPVNNKRDYRLSFAQV